MGTLYLVATPIGNLEDVSLRALRVLREVPLIASEDTRHTRKLLAHQGIRTRQISYHEHSPPARRKAILDALERGDVALVSDAGMPGISDPGADLVREVAERGHTVTPIPGPSAIVTALAASGFPAEGFLFSGYLPRRALDRRRRLEELAAHPGTIVVFEVPHRLRGALSDLAAVFGEERAAVVCRELTKVHEELIRGSLRDLRDHFADLEPRGEFTLVIAGAAQTQDRWTEADVRTALRERMRRGESASRAARQVAADSGWRRNEVYRIALEAR